MTISIKSKKFFTKKKQILYKRYKKNPNKNKFLSIVRRGVLPRPNYALCILLAAQQAKELGYKSFKILEFGCNNFDGIVDIEHFVNDIKEFLDIDCEIFGFTLKTGLPKYNVNPYDRLYRWSPGEMGLINNDNYKNIKSAKIYFGDVKKTVLEFKKKYKKTFKDSPIGFCIFDLDYYTSTKSALNILNMNPNFYLPRTHLYFDDHSWSSLYEGERKAVMEFNKKNKNKISDIGELAEILSIYWFKWIFLGKRIQVINFNKHKKFNKRVEHLDIAGDF